MHTNLSQPDVSLKTRILNSGALGCQKPTRPTLATLLPSGMETHGSLSQYVSFSLIDVGSALIAYMVLSSGPLLPLSSALSQAGMRGYVLKDENDPRWFGLYLVIQDGHALHFPGNSGGGFAGRVEEERRRGR
eukprot:1160048-Pelagomonas_calceolata.AAC.12